MTFGLKPDIFLSIIPDLKVGVFKNYDYKKLIAEYEENSEDV